MKKTVLTLIVTFLAGIAVGAGLMLLAYPFLFPPPILNENIEDRINKQKLYSGQFIHPNPSDPIHWGKGGVSIYRDDQQQTELFLEADFEVGPGPAYHVFLSRRSSIKTDVDFENSQSIDLGKLKSFKAGQIYLIPSGLELSNYPSVVIWCVAFDQLISSARLRKVQTP